jgi:hypothetical protein
MQLDDKVASSPLAQIDAEAKRYYVPVCLYPHTKYRTKAGATFLFERFLADSEQYLIVIADRLYALDRLVTGRYWNYDSVFIKARREAGEVLSLFERIAKRAGAARNGKIVYWDDIAAGDAFKRFASGVRTELSANVALDSSLEAFVKLRVDRFGMGSDQTKEAEFEREYLLSEVSMSMYCTEVLGFSTEVWEKPVSQGVPDPLGLIYSDHRDLVARTTGHAAARRLHFLYEGEVEG